MPANVLRLKTKLLLKRCIGREPWLKPEIDLELHRYGDWAFWSAPLGKSPVVYSAGIGHDIHFERSLIRDFNAAVFAFDPTPGIADWVEDQGLSSAFSFYPCALSGSDGKLDLYPRVRRDGSLSESMFSVVSEAQSMQHRVTVPTKSFTTINSNLGHARVDILKMDIEGAEYDALSSVIFSSVLPNQILVEFHHRFAGMGKTRTEDVVSRLRNIGYRLVYMSAIGREFSFVRTLPN